MRRVWWLTLRSGSSWPSWEKRYRNSSTNPNTACPSYSLGDLWRFVFSHLSSGNVSRLPRFIKTALILLIAQVKNEDADFGWGVVVNFSKKTNTKVSQTLRSLMLLCFIGNKIINTKLGIIIIIIIILIIKPFSWKLCCLLKGTLNPSHRSLATFESFFLSDLSLSVFPCQLLPVFF